MAAALLPYPYYFQCKWHMSMVQAVLQKSVLEFQIVV
jgi:hypothetical protein